MGDQQSCVYDEPYRGKCGNDSIAGTDPSICEHHSEKECWCGAQAVQGCVAATSFVCGQPLCEEHDCHRKGSGMTGTTYHSETGREQYEEWKEQQS